MTSVPKISAVILAGGRARRLGGVDKASLPICGRPMIEWVIAGARPQADELAINVQEARPEYEAYGLPLWPDTAHHGAGPLAGILTAMDRAAHDHLWIMPCDTPLLPAGLCLRLYRAMRAHGARAVTVHDGVRLHPVLSLLQRRLRDSLAAYLDRGERAAHLWLQSIDSVPVDCRDLREAFININTPDDVRHCERLLCG